MKFLNILWLFVGVVVADLAYNDPSIYDGDCSNPPPAVPLTDANLLVSFHVKIH